jgi:plasmid stabilization system protein ParE
VRVKLHADARDEIRSAALWYQEHRDGLGEEFVAAVDEVLLKIAKTPQLFPRWVGTEKVSSIIRKASLERFPYVVAFEQHKRYVLVLAIAHQKRRPLYWLTRSSQQPG